MKKTLATLALALVTATATFAQVGIGTKTPNANAILDLSSTTKGFLLPRLTTTERTALGTELTTAVDPLAKGIQVFDSVLNKLFIWDGTSWVDGSASYTGSSSVVLNGTSFQRAALTGDVTAAVNNNQTTIAENAVTSSKILNSTIANEDLNTGVGGLYKGSGSLTGETIVTQGANTLEFTSSSTNGFSVDGTTFSVDALNNRVGIGTAAPTSALEVTGAATNTTAENSGSSTTIDFGSSNLAYTTATSTAITLTNLKDGGAYTLIFTSTSTGANIVNFTATGFTFRYMGTTARTPGKRHIYSFIVAQSNVYVTMAIEN